jgi:MFS family permease
MSTFRQSMVLYETTHMSDTNHAKPASRFRLFLNTIKNKDLSVPAVLLSSFLNLLGFTMASPIQPALGKHFDLPLGASFGSLSSAYPLGMMLGVFLWPTLSDVIGRKIIMAITLAGSGMGLMLQSYGVQRQWTLRQFLAARVLTGCFAGNSPISKAYLADRGSEGNGADLTKYLAWKDAASTLAFIVGPMLGGLLYQGGKSVVDNTKSISFVIMCSAFASLAASVSIIACVKNNITKYVTVPKPAATNSTTTSVIESDAKAESSAIVSCPLGTRLWTGVVTVAGVTALYHVADSTFFAFFPSLLHNRLHFDTQVVGLAFTMFAFISFSMSAFVSSGFVRRFGPVAACSTGLGTIGAALLALGYASSRSEIRAVVPFVLGAASLYYVGVPLYGPSVPSMLLQCVPANRRGVVMGLDGIVNTISRVVSPLVMGEIHRRYGAGPCFSAAGLFVYAAVVLALIRRWLVLRKDFKASTKQ